MARMATPPEFSRRSAWLILALVLSGLALRSYHYLRVPAVWHDEAALIVNVLNKNFPGLLGPLPWHDAAPLPRPLLVSRAALVFGPCAPILSPVGYPRP